MSSGLNISRRDFLNGVAMATAAGSMLSPMDLLAAQVSADYYPPLRTGMRGSHPGSFEVAHGVSWAGHKYPTPKQQTDDVYDMIVVGGGISGLSSALFYHQRAGVDKNVLVLDNHDDFGGHAKRNEFNVNGQTLIGYGGSQSIDGPGNFSAASSRMLKDVGIVTERFYDYFDQDYMRNRNLRRAIYFSSEVYGREVTAPNILRGDFGDDPKQLDAIVAQYPISDESKAALLRLWRDETDHRPDLSRSEKIDFLGSIAYTKYLREYVGMPRQVTDLLRDTILGLWGVGWDSLSALEAYRSGMPALQHMGLGELAEQGHERDEPYIFHFPDGNAGLARSLVRSLLPNAVPGSTMEDLVMSRIDYSLLDRRKSPTRIRLNSTAVNLHHTPDQKHVDVTYVTDGDAYRVRAKHVVFAGYNAMLPYICGEVPPAQKEAIAYAEKVPLVYMSIAVRNWHALAEMGYSSVFIPRSKYIYSFGLDFPVSMGDYRFTQDPQQPTVLHGSWVPNVPEQGLSAREQHVAGRRQLYELSFDDFEQDIVEKMSGSLAPGGFDAERDIAAITVNRWPHGYAYEYNDLSDPEGFTPQNGPHVAGRAQIGRISIANSDASAYAYVNGAIDAADRAVNEQMQTA
ncbi:MAG TPA: FAD/NAD(P)-binding protein [Woeseiaceae bacterium]|nr:FAD/NAD(P)-binding protein [Woeseiaceae bacterium]